MTILDELIAAYNRENQSNEVENSPKHYVDLIDQNPKEVGVLRLPESMYKKFFNSLIFLISNWKHTKENEDFYPELSRRTGSIIENSPRMPDDFGLGIQNLVVQIDEQEGQEMFRRMSEYGNYDVETLREVAKKTYEMRQNSGEMFDGIRDIEQRVAGDRKENLQLLKDEIRDDYL